jgi:putative transposase
MARMARLVVPHYPHHVTQRGNRRQKTFFSEEDYQAYMALMVNAKTAVGIEILAYCLMPNHVHFVVVPEAVDGLAKLFSDAHRLYTRRINFREGWRGHLWQERFHSFVMDEAYLLAAVRYTELNPVRAGLCKQAEDWPWSSARAHLCEKDDDLVSVLPMLERISCWREYLSIKESHVETEKIRLHARTGRPMGGEAFIDSLEALTGRSLILKKPGPKVK